MFTIWTLERKLGFSAHEYFLKIVAYRRYLDNQRNAALQRNA